jgi:hypothetical protein
MRTVTSRGFLILALTFIATSSWGKESEDCFALKAKKPTPEQQGVFFGKVRGYNSETVKTSISAMSHTCNVTLEESKRVYENLTKRGWEVINSDGNASKDWKRAIIDVGSGRSYVAYHSKQNVLAIVFRGTGVKGDGFKKAANIIKDGQIRLIKLPWLPKKKHVSDWKALSKDRYKNWGKLKVHKGFAKEYDKFLKHIGNRVGSFLKRSTQKKPKVYCMGFSLGAALATHCAAHVKMRFGVETNLLVGASPRVGSQEFQNKYDNLIKGSLRVMLEKDPVPQVPGVMLKEKYEHVGHRLLPLFVDGKRISENHLSSITHVLDNLRGKKLQGVPSVIDLQGCTHEAPQQTFKELQKRHPEKIG